MTVHNFVQGLATGPAQPVPSNCNGKQLAYYSKSRFDVTLRVFTQDGVTFIGRECPACGATS